MFLTTSTFNPDFQLDFRLKDFKKKTENLRCQLYFQKSENPSTPHVISLTMWRFPRRSVPQTTLQRVATPRLDPTNSRKTSRTKNAQMPH